MYILLVEDNADNAGMIIRLLEGAGYAVKHTVSGLESLQIARKERPSLILMDFDLPDADGRTIIPILRKQLGGPDAPPIVAVTAGASVTDMALAEKYGCAAFIGKPFRPETLLSVVRSFVSQTNDGAELV